MINSPEITLRVAIYIRVSTDEQVERYGIPLQREALLALIKSRPKLEGGRDGMILAGVKDEYIYIDQGVSGTVELAQRPAFSKLIEDITLAPVDQRPFDVVAVYRIDRFARSLKILLEAIDFFEDNGVKFISANESIDTSTPFGRAMLGIIGVIAELERATIKQRTIAGREQAFEAGTVLGVNAPFGYIKDPNKKYKVLEPEAVIVQQIFDMFVNEDRSVEYIARQLTKQEVLSPEVSAIRYLKRKGSSLKKTSISYWRPNRIMVILKDEIYIGKIYGNMKKDGKELPKNEWKLSQQPSPMIIDDVLFEKKWGQPPFT